MTKSRLNEDWLAVLLGLFFLGLSLGPLFGADLLGWAVTTSVWTSIGKALAPASKAYAGLSGAASLALTFVFLAAVLTAGAAALRFNTARFVRGLVVVFGVAYLSWIVGSWAYIAATPDKRSGFGIGWSLNLTNEAGYIVALLAGLAIGNLLPGLANWMKDAIRPELYIKIAI